MKNGHKIPISELSKLQLEFIEKEETMRAAIFDEFNPVEHFTNNVSGSGGLDARIQRQLFNGTQTPLFHEFD
jgi:hypothetical protein